MKKDLTTLFFIAIILLFTYLFIMNCSSIFNLGFTETYENKKKEGFTKKKEGFTKKTIARKKI